MCVYTTEAVLLIGEWFRYPNWGEGEWVRVLNSSLLSIRLFLLLCIHTLMTHNIPHMWIY